MSDTIKIRIFHETVTCRSCGHQWLGYLSGFSRGHGVLERDGRIAFVPDDIAYEIIDHIRALPQVPNTWVNDPAEVLREYGWRDVERCPRCGVTDFLPQYQETSMVEVPCIEFVASDFKLIGNHWSLTESGRAKVNGK